MNKAKLFLIGISLFLLFGLSLFIYTKIPVKNEATILPISQKEHEKQLKEADDMLANLTKDGGVYNQAIEKLQEEGYEFLLLSSIYSNDKIEIKFVLTDKETTTKELKEVSEIFNDILVKNNFNPKSFKVKVTNDDNPNW